MKFVTSPGAYSQRETSYFTILMICQDIHKSMECGVRLQNLHARYRYLYTQCRNRYLWPSASPMEGLLVFWHCWFQPVSSVSAGKCWSLQIFCWPPLVSTGLRWIVLVSFGLVSACLHLCGTCCTQLDFSWLDCSTSAPIDFR